MNQAKSSGMLNRWTAGPFLVFVGMFVVNFLFLDSSLYSSLRWAALSTAIAVLLLAAWHIFRISRFLDWLSRHSPLRRVPKTLAIVITAFTLVVLFAFTTFSVIFLVDQSPREPYISYSDFKNKVQAKELGEYIILKRYRRVSDSREDLAFFLDLTDGQKKWTYFEIAPASIPQQSPEEWLDNRGYNISQQREFPFGYVLMNLLGGFMMSIPFFFFLWIIGGGGLRTMSAEISSISHSKRGLKEAVRFKDVAGIDPVIESLKRYVFYLKNPERYKRLRARMPKGALLWGPPGVGKTFAARALAGEAGVPIYRISGSDFNFMFVGVGSARAENIFEHAIRTAPSIIILDEIDSAGGKRGGVDFGGAARERDSLVNKLNSILDRIHDEDIPVIIIGTTNLIEALDSSLFRPGRFDTKIYVPLPDANGRKAILGVHLVAPDPELIADDVDMDEIVRRTRNWSGADLENLANASRIEAVERGDGEQIHHKNILSAYEFVSWGPETHLDLPEKEKERVRYHEGAHAVASLVLPEADPSEYVTTKTHSGTLGHAFPIPERDYHLESKTRYLTRIKVFLAGYAVEIALYGEPSTDAKRDLINATSFAKSMVFEYGMDEEIGPVALDALNSGSSQTGQFGMGQSAIIARAHERVQAILNECSNEMHAFFSSDEGKKVLEDVAQKLHREKTLSRAQLEEIIPKEMLDRRTAKS